MKIECAQCGYFSWRRQTSQFILILKPIALFKSLNCYLFIYNFLSISIMSSILICQKLFYKLSFILFNVLKFKIVKKTIQKKMMFRQSPQKQSSSDSESFYSINNSKQEFTVIQQSPQQPQLKQTSSKLVKLYGIKQSSAILDEQSSNNELNEPMHSIYMDKTNEFQGMNINQISGIHPEEINQLQCSVCLQKQISCLNLPIGVSLEEAKLIQKKIEGIKNGQSRLLKQIQVFQGLTNEYIMSDIMRTGKFMKKKCQHSQSVSSPFNFNWPDPNQISIKSIQQPQPTSPPKQTVKHFDIKPNQVRTESQQRINDIYKSASFNSHIVLLDDSENEYKIEVFYSELEVSIEVVNYTKGDTNFIYAVRLNENGGEGSQNISEKVVFPLTRYIEKKFTLSLNVLLLFFQQGKPKQQKHLIKIDQIRTLSVPLPLVYLMEARFTNTPSAESIKSKIQNQLYIYEIDINYNGDRQSYQRLRESQWLRNKWFSLKGSQKVLKVELKQMKQKQNDYSMVFQVGSRQQDCQQAIDIIQYLCFMLAK